MRVTLAGLGCGTADSVTEEVREALRGADAVIGAARLLNVLRGLLAEEKPLLETYPDGIRITDCAMVHLNKDVPPEMILERLSVEDCAQVFCTPEQEAAVTVVSKDVAMIGGKDEESGFATDMVTGMLHLNPSVKVVNASEYVM